MTEYRWQCCTLTLPGTICAADAADVHRQTHKAVDARRDPVVIRIDAASDLVRRVEDHEHRLTAIERTTT